jgi:hypothetical protein
MRLDSRLRSRRIMIDEENNALERIDARKPASLGVLSAEDASRRLWFALSRRSRALNRSTTSAMS